MHKLSVAALLALAIAAPAQTLVVDVNGGPGTNFTSIAAATAAAPSGAVLSIRAGNYPQFTIIGKSLTLLADPGVVVFSTAVGGTGIGISGLASGQTVVLKDLQVSQGFPTDSARIQCTNCQGPILFDSVRMASNANGLQFTVSNCDRLVVRHMDLGSGLQLLTVNNCNTVLEGCAFGGFTSGSAIVQQGGTLDLVDTATLGGLPFGVASSPIVVNGGELRLLGISSVFALGPIFLIGGTTGSVSIDPAVTLTGNGFAPGLTVVTKATSSLTTTFTGTHAEATLNAPSGWFGAIAISLPGPRVQLVGMDDAVWLDGGALQFLASGLTGPGTPVVASVPWTLGLLAGYPSMWQGVTFDPVDGLQVSNPSLLVLR
jgi:hypothetical protein